MVSRAGTINKISVRSELDRYGKSMRRNIDSKSSFTLTYLRKKNGGTTLDIGCCDGSLLNTLCKLNPVHTYVGIDIAEGFVQKAQQTYPLIDFKLMDAFDLDNHFEPGQFDNVILSSIIHEIFSYSQKPYLRSSLDILFQKLNFITRNEGRIIISDPAKPINPNKIIKVIFDDKNGSNNITNSKIHVKDLSTAAKFLRFIKEFRAINSVKVFLIGNENTFIMNNWLFSEFLRHRNLHETPAHWEAEMHEVYGALTPDEIINIAARNNFKVISAQNFYKQGHFSCPKNNEIQVYDEFGLLDIEDIYNSHSRYVFQKYYA